MDYARLAAETKWLLDNPAFSEQPATIDEFLGPGYLDIRSKVRPGLQEALRDVFGKGVNNIRMSRYERAMLTGAIGIGKGHTPETPILTPSGFKALRELAVGDRIIGSDGMSTEITGYYPRGQLEAYRVTMTDGSSVVVDGDHLWNVQSPSQKARGGAWSTISTRDLIEAGLKTDRGQAKWHIPVVKTVEYDHVEPTLIAPYLLGALLGDGGLTQTTPIITSADHEILERVQAESGQIGRAHV